eukprot:42124-Eustigmatos_ZCMA.PRE.1
MSNGSYAATDAAGRVVASALWAYTLATRPSEAGRCIGRGQYVFLDRCTLRRLRFDPRPDKGRLLMHMLKCSRSSLYSVEA